MFFGNDFTKLSIYTDNAGWSLDWDAIELEKIAKKIGINVSIGDHLPPHARQCIHYESQFVLGKKETYDTSNRFSVDYYHGMAHQGKEFKDIVDLLKIYHHKVTRIRVSQSIMEKYLLEEINIERQKVYRIPIGINIDKFHPVTAEEKRKIRESLGIPDGACVIGSFQKDGVGWEEGLEPKFIKGPDVFINTVRILKDKIPNLFILLSGPARGYVKTSLEKLKIPYYHEYLKNYLEDLPRFYNAIDLYIVPAREEGGPKSILESMASRIPIISTRVGQAVDMIKHGYNGWLVEVEDYEGLAFWADYVINNNINIVLDAAEQTAKENAYSSQIDLWRSFFNGYVRF